MPAVKYRMFDDPAEPSLPNASDQRPLIEIGLPLGSVSSPRELLFVALGSKASIQPLPAAGLPKLKFPTRRSPANLPNLAGAIAMPHGLLSTPSVAMRRMKPPFVSYSSTTPPPAASV